MSQTFSKFCDELHTSDGFRYTPPSGYPQREGCEPTWYAQNGTVIGHKIPLVRDFCESVIRLVIRCFASDEAPYERIFKVTNRTTPDGLLGSPNGTTSSNNGGQGFEHLYWLLLVPLAPFVYYVYRNCIRRARKKILSEQSL